MVKMTRQEDLRYIIDTSEIKLKELYKKPNSNYGLITELEQIKNKAEIEYLRNLLNEVGNK